MANATETQDSNDGREIETEQEIKNKKVHLNRFENELFKNASTIYFYFNFHGLDSVGQVCTKKILKTQTSTKNNCSTLNFFKNS